MQKPRLTNRPVREPGKTVGLWAALAGTAILSGLGGVLIGVKAQEWLGRRTYGAQPAAAPPPSVPAESPKAAPSQPAATPVPEVTLPPAALIEGNTQIPVLMYHDITDRPTVSFDVRTAEFRRHLELLKQARAHVIPLRELYDHLLNGRQLPSRPVVLTFDDTYSGQYENALPLLKEFGYPATFFVHTGVIGKRTSRDHMTWEQLQELEQGGLISIEGHTVSHPDDLRLLDDDQLHRELTESKQLLEQKLSKKIRFLAYPVGKADGRVAAVARKAGYELAFTMGSTGPSGARWAASPADAYFVPRVYPGRIQELCSRLESEEPIQLQFRAAVAELSAADLEMGKVEDGQVHMRWVRGGRLSTLRLLGRRDVPTMVQMAGAAAGINGTFFSDARVNSAGSGIVGPVISRFGPGFAPGLPGDRERISGRPLVVIGPEKIGFFPFQPDLLRDTDGLERLVSGATDAFIGGAWLVHEGRPLTHEELETFRLSNVFDFRPRAFFGVDSEGRILLGASSTGNASDRLAETLASLDLQECVLLDSGFSTSLVVGKAVLVSGIRRKDMPARPVPHILVLHPLDPVTKKEVLALPRLGPEFVGPTQPPSFEQLQAALSKEMPSLVQGDAGTRGKRRGRRNRGGRRARPRR